jgi:hypothetical protein
MATTAQALTVPCPACQSPAFHPCTQATSTARVTVKWVHMAREEEWRKLVDQQAHDYYLTFGIQYYDEPHPEWPECNPKGYVRITAPDYEQARVIAIERFGLHWSMLTPAPNFNPRFFPAGELMVLP